MSQISHIFESTQKKGIKILPAQDQINNKNPDIDFFCLSTMINGAKVFIIASFYSANLNKVCRREGCGIGNGYIVFPNANHGIINSHLFEEDYREEMYPSTSSLHGGITCNSTLVDFMRKFNVEIKDINCDDYHVIGFDTSRRGDIEKFNTLESIFKELLEFLFE